MSIRTLTALLTEATTGTGFGYCIGQFCNGPDVEPEDMVTCWRCRLLHDLREAMDDGTDDTTAAFLTSPAELAELYSPGVPMPAGLRADLRALLDYGWQSEERDYGDNPDERHVFLAMRRLSAWLDAKAESDRAAGQVQVRKDARSILRRKHHHG